MASKSKAIVAVAALPEPNERAKAAMFRARERVLARRKLPTIKIAGTGPTLSMSSPHADESGQDFHLLDTFGTSSHAFLNGALSQLLDSIRDRDGIPTETAINSALAIVAGIQPENETEALLASQMAATHALAMLLVGRTRRVDQLNQAAVNGGLAVKLLRTFTLQAETLSKLRRGGGQTVRIEHVHVHPGGQAIVGAVTTGGGSQMKSEEQPHAKPAALTHADAPFDPLRSTNAECERVPVARNA